MFGLQIASLANYSKLLEPFKECCPNINEDELYKMVPANLMVNLGFKDVNCNYDRLLLNQGLKIRAFYDYGSYKHHLDKLFKTLDDTEKQFRKAVDEKNSKNLHSDRNHIKQAGLLS